MDRRGLAATGINTRGSGTRGWPPGGSTGPASDLRGAPGLVEASSASKDAAPFFSRGLALAAPGAQPARRLIQPCPPTRKVSPAVLVPWPLGGAENVSRGAEAVPCRVVP